MAVMRAGDAWAAAVDAEVGAWLRAQGAHYGSSRVEPDGTRAVSWYFEPHRRRERVLVFRRRDDGADGSTDEVVLAERHCADPDGGVREVATAAGAPGGGLLATARSLLADGLARGRPTRPPRRPVDLGSPALGVVLAVALVLGARLEITAAPELLALALPLLGVSGCRLVARLARAVSR